MREVLTDDSFADEDAMARALLQTAYGMFRDRSWWTIAHQVTPNSFPLVFYGLEGTEKAAEKFAVGLGVGRAKLVPVHSTDEFAVKVEEQNHDGELKYRDLPCITCGHRAWMHGAVGYKGQKVATPAKKACNVNCKCKSYIKPE